ncbi:MAG: alpha/beta fold hydrolase [Planctomycetes bacterium]|nr:alpha/beta fold hydrolase [Planctomycetota bacterium]
MKDCLVDGPAKSLATVVLAHGAGAGMEHAFLQTVALGLAKRGLRVVRFEFRYMQARREGRRPGPDRMPALLERMREIAIAQKGPVILAGKSMGGRVATMLADEIEARGVVVFGYPFHPPGKPENLRTAHLETLETPTLILQGERDTFGTREEVAKYRLSKRIRIEWIPDGDHSFKPRKRSGFTLESGLETAIAAAAEFVTNVAS